MSLDHRRIKNVHLFAQLDQRLGPYHGITVSWLMQVEKDHPAVYGLVESLQWIPELFFRSSDLDHVKAAVRDAVITTETPKGKRPRHG